MCALAAISGLTGNTCPSVAWTSGIACSFPFILGLEAGILGHVDDAVLDLDHHRFEAVAETGAAEALAVGDAEFRSVRGADDTAAVVREEAVGDPFQRRADMRAVIDVDVDRVALADSEQAG